MGFETGVATSQDDFMTKLTTFASANGWTTDEINTTTNQAGISLGNVFTQFKWNDTDAIAGYQSLGWAGATAPGAQLDDSGNGDISGAIDADRRWAGIGNGPFTKYWLFEDAATVAYVYYVLEYAPGFFVHGSFGNVEKFGTWTGGEYHAMSIWPASATTARDVDGQAMVDSVHNVAGQTATIHAEGLPGQAGASKWGLFLRAGVSLGTDRGANARIRFLGGSRAGYLTHAFQGIRANPNNGFVPMVPLLAYHAANAEYLGKFVDVVEMNGFFLNAGSTITVGSDTWHVFPVHRKATSGVTSGNLYLAYRQRA